MSNVITIICRSFILPLSIENQILHSDKDHQMPFVGGPHTRITNQRWRTAAILEKSKNCYISAAVQPILTKYGKMMHFENLDRPDR